MISQSLSAPASVSSGTFAAPGSQVLAAPANNLGNALEMILALVVVLLTIFAIAWLLRRLKSLPDARQSLLRSEAELAVGEKERVVLLAMGSRRWLLGVTPGGISVLQALDNDPVATGESSALNLGSAGAAAPASFATVLRRSLGMAP